MAATFVRPAFRLMAFKVFFWTAITSALTAAMNGCQSSHFMRGKRSYTNSSNGSRRLTDLETASLRTDQGIRQIVGHTPGHEVRYETGDVCLYTHLHH